MTVLDFLQSFSMFEILILFLVFGLPVIFLYFFITNKKFREDTLFGIGEFISTVLGWIGFLLLLIAFLGVGYVILHFVIKYW